VLPNAGVIKRIHIQKAVDKYLKICTSQKCVKNQKVEKKFFSQFIEFMSNLDREVISDITYSDLLEFQNLLSSKMKSSSVNRRFFTIKHFLVMCDRWGYLLKNPAKDIKNKKVERNPYKTWTVDEFNLLLGECDGVYKSLIEFLWNTGCRPMEAKNLKWTDIDYDKLEIVLRCGKNAKISRIFPMTDKVSKILHNMTMRGHSVFQNIGNDSLYQYTMHRLRKVSIKNRSPYGWRHSFASRLSKAGVNVFLIQKLMGHYDIKTTSGYVHSEKNELIEALLCANY